MSAPRYPVDLVALRDDLAKLDGLPPHDEGSNICRGDPYFAAMLAEKYGRPVDELRKIAETPRG